MIRKKEKARVTAISGPMLQVYYQASYWNAVCVGNVCLSVNDFVDVVGDDQLPLQVVPAMV